MREAATDDTCCGTQHRFGHWEENQRQCRKCGHVETRAAAATDKATARPWRYEAETKTIRSMPTNYWLATMDSWDGAINNEANAELIVRCVNSHDALVEALRTIADQAERATLVQDRSVSIIKQVCGVIASEARAALAEAD